MPSKTRRKHAFYWGRRTPSDSGNRLDARRAARDARGARRAGGARRHRHGRPYVVVVYDDDWHTFEEVEVQLQKATGCTLEKAEALSHEIDGSGRAIVFAGSQGEVRAGRGNPAPDPSASGDGPGVTAPPSAPPGHAGPRPALAGTRPRLRRVESRNVTFLAPDFPIFWDRAEGCLVTDVDGNTFLDMTAASASRASATATRASWPPCRPRAKNSCTGWATFTPRKSKSPCANASLSAFPSPTRG